MLNVQHIKQHHNAGNICSIMRRSTFIFQQFYLSVGFRFVSLQLLMPRGRNKLPVFFCSSWASGHRPFFPPYPHRRVESSSETCRKKKAREFAMHGGSDRSRKWSLNMSFFYFFRIFEGISRNILKQYLKDFYQ